MQRWHLETQIAFRQQQRHLKFWDSLLDQIVLPDSIEELKSKNELGRFRKQHAGDCGRPRCQLCHYDKILKTPRRQEQISSLRMKEGLDELEEIYGR